MDERVERGMRRQLAAAPPDRIGWKLALNAPAILERLGLGEPALGWLCRRRVSHGSHSLAGATRPAVEPELLVEAGEGGSVAALGLALEVVDFDRGLDDVEEVVATNVFHRAVAFSEPRGRFGPGGEEADGGLGPPGEGIFSLNGDLVARVRPDEPPAETLAFVDRFLHGLGRGLAEGELVIAGALAPAAPVAPGDVASLSMPAVGEIALEFTA